MKRVLVAVLLLASCVGVSTPRAQMRVVPVNEQQGHTALGLALRHLNNTGIFMMATAHPDDENNALLVMLNRGQGYRTALATATRGNGGQNEIGPEIFEALGILRTEELAALHRFDGAEQYFTRAVDFGFSFSVDETFEKWGREEILADYVRLIRTIRPDVITALSPNGDGGGQHHQASAILAREAFLAAGDETKFPEQISGGLRVWQPKKFYFSSGFAGGRAPAASELTINLTGYDRLLGKTYAEIGTEARSMHKCQGMAQLLTLPGPSSTSYTLAETTLAAQKTRAEASLFDGIDATIGGLIQFAGPRPPKELKDGLDALAATVLTAQRRFDEAGAAAAVAPLSTGLRAVRVLRGTLRGLSIAEPARFEIDFRLRQKEREFQQASLLAGGVRVEALADDGVVVPGQPVRLSVIVANRGAADVVVRDVKFEGFEGEASCVLSAPAPAGRGGRGGQASASPSLPSLPVGQVGQCAPSLRIPATLKPSEPYWHRDGEAGRYTFDSDVPFGVPYRPTPFYVMMSVTIGGGTEILHAMPVEYRYQGDIFSGEKRSELLVVPAWSVRLSPEIAIVPYAPLPPPAPAPATQGRGRGARPPAAAPAAGRGARPAAAAPAPAPAPPPGSTREVRATIVNDTKGPADGIVRLELPAGWSATPAEQPVSFTRESEAQTVRFQVRPGPDAAVGGYQVKAVASVGGATFDRGYQVIEYPHIRRQHIYYPASAALKIVDIKTAPNLTVGYVMGVGDAVPPAIEQLGAKVEMIGPDDLAWGDLSRFSSIVTGVRAYERRADLRAQNNRLLEYVRNGGTLIVQYNKMEFNEAQYGPWSATVSSQRATDESAPVRMLVPGDPLLNTPNKLTDATWKGWVQERGLYFLGEHDSRYRELLAIDEPFPNNQGEKRGALVVGNYGRGRWVYVGLGLWRELPAGVDGAYQLLANLISLKGT